MYSESVERFVECYLVPFITLAERCTCTTKVQKSGRFVILRRICIKTFFKDVRLWDYVELWNQLQALNGHTINCNFLIYISLHSSLFCRRKSDNMWNSDVKWHKTVFMMLDCAIALLLRVVRKCAFWKDYLT